ncbi:MAG: RNA polymerase sigma factor [Actinobacteria bacterium]|nr:RNA polymerase sigma factor [Actinomycetota bacterium]
MQEKKKTDEVRRLAAEIYEERHDYLLRIARRNAASGSDAEEALQEAFAYFIAGYDPDSGAPPLAWITTTMKRRCWRLRDGAHLERRAVSGAGAPHQEPTETIDGVSCGATPLADRVAECDEARRNLRRLKPDQRTALGMVAAGCSYEEVGRLRGWSPTKVNRCLYEGRRVLDRGATH